MDIGGIHNLLERLIDARVREALTRLAANSNSNTISTTNNNNADHVNNNNTNTLNEVMQQQQQPKPQPQPQPQPQTQPQPQPQPPQQKFPYDERNLHSENPLRFVTNNGSQTNQPQTSFLQQLQQRKQLLRQKQQELQRQQEQLKQQEKQQQQQEAVQQNNNGEINEEMISRIIVAKITEHIDRHVTLQQQQTSTPKASDTAVAAQDVVPDIDEVIPLASPFGPRPRELDDDEEDDELNIAIQRSFEEENMDERELQMALQMSREAFVEDQRTTIESLHQQQEIDEADPQSIPLPQRLRQYNNTANRTAQQEELSPSATAQGTSNEERNDFKEDADGNGDDAAETPEQRRKIEKQKRIRLLAHAMTLLLAEAAEDNENDEDEEDDTEMQLAMAISEADEAERAQLSGIITNASAPDINEPTVDPLIVDPQQGDIRQQIVHQQNAQQVIVNNETQTNVGQIGRIEIDFDDLDYDNDDDDEPGPIGGQHQQVLLGASGRNFAAIAADNDDISDNELLEIAKAISLVEGNPTIAPITAVKDRKDEVEEVVHEEVIVEEELIDNTVFNCNICFERFPKTDCATFNCLHLFCRDCMNNYIKGLVYDGQIDVFKCPEPNCGLEASQDLIEQFLNLEELQRLQELQLKRAVGPMDDVFYCPKVECQKPVQCEIYATIGECPDCGYVFCTSCLQTFHGTMDCGLTDEDRELMLRQHQRQLSEEAAALAEAQRKREEERRRKQEEEMLSNSTIERDCKKCPKCHVDIEKNFGCNHMTCVNCNVEFCWLCLTIIHGDYRLHFQRDCRLFEEYDSD